MTSDARCNSGAVVVLAALDSGCRANPRLAWLPPVQQSLDQAADRSARRCLVHPGCLNNSGPVRRRVRPGGPAGQAALGAERRTPLALAFLDSQTAFRMQPQ